MLKKLNPDATREEIINTLNELLELIDQRCNVEIERLTQENRHLIAQMELDKKIAEFVGRRR